MLNVIDNCHDDFKFTEKTMESITTLPFIVESQEFDFETLKKNNSIRTLCGLKVKIDRIIYDITHTTPLAISGTFVVQGVKIRGNWDAFGNPCDFKRCYELLCGPRLGLDGLFGKSDYNLLRLTQTDEI